MSVRQGTPKRKRHGGRCQRQAARCAAASRVAGARPTAVVPGHLAGGRAPPARPTPDPRAAGLLEEARRCGARRRERRCPGGGVAASRRGRRPPSAARCGQDACAVRGAAPHRSARSCGHGRRHERRLRRAAEAEPGDKGRAAAMGERLRAQPAAPAGPSPSAAASCSLLGGLRRTASTPRARRSATAAAGGTAPAAATPGAAAAQHGSPAKKCRLRRRVDSGRRHRPRK
uniref:Uncharacterized protein n=1 Tax=Malurus cyaneus samueli TaxID=2593467 RepID=A0A8C5U6Z1_9PASS